MIVAVDIGNSRLKWSVHDGVDWTERGALPTAESGALGDVVAGWPGGAPVVACNVAGAKIESVLAERLRDKHQLHWLRSSAFACGVRSSYAQPATLGADRWAALIGARTRIEDDALVICAGTATTIDHLDARGVFRGGLILPGIDLMRSSLARNTAQLPLADGRFCAEPHSTVDAIVSGCLFAQLGAIERRFAALPTGALCLLTGGAAAPSAAHLSIPHAVADNLILEGLLRFAAECGLVKNR